MTQPDADVARAIHHSVPRNVQAFWDGAECEADVARMAWHAEQTRQLPIGGNAASGDAPHEGIDGFVLEFHVAEDAGNSMRAVGG
jgi:hypothetical protein